MPRKQSGGNFKKAKWRSAKADAQEKSFIMLGASVLQSTKYQKLGNIAKWLFICMDAEAAGRLRFCFRQSTAAEKYGISRSSFLRARDELIEKGVIRISALEHIQGEPYEYEFIPDCWINTG